MHEPLERGLGRLPWILTAIALGLALSLWALKGRHSTPPPQSVRKQPEAMPAVQEPTAVRPGGEAVVAALPTPPENRIQLPIYPRFTEQDANALFSIGPNEVFDPLCGKRYKPNQRIPVRLVEHPDRAIEFVINGRSMREDEEPRIQRPRVRVLVAGDAQAEGVCSNSESFANLVEAGLKRRALTQSRKRGERFDPDSIEVLNAGKGGYTFHGYLGVLERNLDLRPDTFVVAVNGGNDFVEALPIWHHYSRAGTRPPGAESYAELVEAATAIYRGALGQGLLTVKYFDVHPEQKSVAVAAAVQVFDHMQALCRERGIRLIVLYLPPRHDIETDNPQLRLASLLEALRLQRSALANTNEMADRLLAQLAAAGIETIDLRVAFRAAAESLYWKADWSLNLAGHRIVTQALLPVLSAER